MKPALAALLVILGSADTTWACAIVLRGNNAVAVASESAIIVWDSRTKTEHFIRRASFQTSGYDFGFIVPTPSKPELAEVRASVFNHLEPLLVPEVITKRPLFGLNRVASHTFSYVSSEINSTSGGVNVLESKRVAGYDAVVLEADDAEKLNEWLGKHGFVSRPGLVKWFEPYIKAKWKITAFKVAPQVHGQNQVRLDAVRLSFQTERPFYPYREPEDAQAIARIQDGGADSRRLRVFFLGTERMEGCIGEKKPREWPGKVKWAGALPEATRASVLADLGLSQAGVAEQLRLTAFEDTSSPRPGVDEVFFSRAADQSEVWPEPIIEYLNDPIITLEEVALGLFLLLSGFVMLRMLVRPERAAAG